MHSFSLANRFEKWQNKNVEIDERALQSAGLFSFAGGKICTKR